MAFVHKAIKDFIPVAILNPIGRFYTVNIKTVRVEQNHIDHTCSGFLVLMANTWYLK